jgi:hypothetical protein
MGVDLEYSKKSYNYNNYLTMASYIIFNVVSCLIGEDTFNKSITVWIKDLTIQLMQAQYLYSVHNAPGQLF